MHLLERLLEVPEAEREQALAGLADESPEVVAELRARIAAAAAMPADFLPIPDTPSDLVALRPGDMVGVYRIVRQIESSRMSHIYEAWDTHMERRVALKVLRRSASGSTGLVRFEQELRAMAALEHPNIVNVHSGGIRDGLLYIDMQYLDGKNLAAAMVDAAYRKPEWVLRAALCLSSAFATMHEAEIYHRDIKPQNIFLTRDGTLKVIDFGIARRNNGGCLTTTGYVACTPEYAPPEALAGEGSDHSWDIYSFGVVLYELLAGHRPVRNFRGAAPDVTPLRNAGAPERLTELISQCLSYDWRRRPESFRKIEEELRSVAADSSSPAEGSARRSILAATVAGVIAGGALVAFLLFRAPVPPTVHETPAAVAPTDPTSKQPQAARSTDVVAPQVRGPAAPMTGLAEPTRERRTFTLGHRPPQPTVRLEDPPPVELPAVTTPSANAVAQDPVSTARLVLPAAPVPAPAAESGPALQSPAAARSDLSKVLRAIETSYSRGDENTLRRLWPTIPADHLSKLRQALDVGTVSFSLTEAGEPRFAVRNGVVTAEWTCQRSMLQTTRGAQPGRPSVRRAVARFERRDNVWLLVGLEY